MLQILRRQETKSRLELISFLVWILCLVPKQEVRVRSRQKQAQSIKRIERERHRMIIPNQKNKKK